VRIRQVSAERNAKSPPRSGKNPGSLFARCSPPAAAFNSTASSRPERAKGAARSQRQGWPLGHRRRRRAAAFTVASTAPRYRATGWTLLTPAPNELSRLYSE